VNCSRSACKWKKWEDGARRREDYLEWRDVFVVVCDGLRWRRRWLALLFFFFFPVQRCQSLRLLLLFFFLFSFSWFSPLYLCSSPLFFLSIPLFFFFLSSSVFFSLSLFSFFLSFCSSSAAPFSSALSSPVFIGKYMKREACYPCPVMAQG